ncbi:MAG: DUF3604 domain-containing protein [Halieaceae bacterium]|nr:DUF3604 domain-containing protein [Halieaceae bacterium]
MGADHNLDNDGKLALVGSTVDIEQANRKDTIGDSQLATVWQDHAFGPTQHAFYYVRVLQIPTPRWPVYDAARFDTDRGCFLTCPYQKPCTC